MILINRKNRLLNLPRLHSIQRTLPKNKYKVEPKKEDHVSLKAGIIGHIMDYKNIEKIKKEKH